MSKDSELASSILNDIGGKDNVSAVISCMTRLRISVKEVKARAQKNKAAQKAKHD